MQYHLNVFLTWKTLLWLSIRGYTECGQSSEIFRSQPLLSPGSGGKMEEAVVVSVLSKKKPHSSPMQVSNVLEAIVIISI